MAKLTTSELEALIRRTINEKGLGADISNDKIKSIKDIIKTKISGLTSPKAPTTTTEVVPSTNEDEEKDTVFDVPSEVPSAEPGSIPPAVTSAISSNPKETEIARKEGELEQKSQDISNREAQLANRQAELQRKEDELTYQPEIPAVLEGIGPEKVFVFDQNEMSLGAEALSKTNFRMVSNPDEKKSMNDLWLQAGIRKAEIFVVKFEKLGDVTFDPFRGTAVFEEKRFEPSENPESVPKDGGLTPEQASQSQEATEPMPDAIEPVKDVTLPLSQDMGLDSVDMKTYIDNKVEDILRKYLANKGQ